MPLNFFSDDDQVNSSTNESYPTIILGRSDRWLQWYKDHCYPGSWQRKHLNKR